MITNYSDFWDFYVQEHSKPLTRVLHFVGTSLGLVLLAWLAWNRMWLYIPLCFVVGYAFAWFAAFCGGKEQAGHVQIPVLVVHFRL